MAQLELPLHVSLVIDTVARTVRYRVVIVGYLEDPGPGVAWPLQLPEFEGFGTTVDDATRAAFQAYRQARG